MEERQTELRSAIDRVRGGRIRWSCPRSLKSEINSYMIECREAGMTVSEVAGELGVSATSLDRWSAEEQNGKASPGLKPVKVSKQTPGHAGLVLITPRGYRVEGLTIETTLRLLREL